MTANQTDQTNTNPISQPAGAPIAPVTQSVTPTVETAINAASVSNPEQASEAQVNQALDVSTYLPTMGALALQNGLQTALILIAVLLAIIVVWLLRTRKPLDSAGFEVLEAEPNALPNQRGFHAHAPAKPMASRAKSGQVIAAPIAVYDDEDDTSKLEPVNDFDFEDEVTYVFTSKVDQQIVGRLVCVTGEPRFPAELALASTPAKTSGESTIAIGRHSKHNAVVISDKSVSREHAIIMRRGEQLFVRDNKSTAGTLLNWKKLQPDDEQPLHDKDILSFGEAVYEFRLQQEETDGPRVLISEFAREKTELIEK